MGLTIKKATEKVAKEKTVPFERLTTGVWKPVKGKNYSAFDKDDRLLVIEQNDLCCVHEDVEIACKKNYAYIYINLASGLIEGATADWCCDQFIKCNEDIVISGT